MNLYTVSQKLREQLKVPLGTLVEDRDVSIETLRPMLSGKLIVCVGDRTTERISELGFSPNLEIVDLVERRKSRPAPAWGGSQEHLKRVDNPAGSISSDALQSLSDALTTIENDRKSLLRLQVSGEEDLLVLPVVAFFPDDTVVLYGQPLEGLVIVSARDVKSKAREYLRSMGITSLSQRQERPRMSLLEMLKSPRAAITQNLIFIKFMLVGASGVVVGLVLLSILKTWMHPAIANTISVEATILSNFTLNDLFTFRHTNIQSSQGTSCRLYRLVKYNLVSLAGLVVNSLVFYILYGIGLFYVWSYLIAVLAAFMLNYFGSSRWAWRSRLVGSSAQ